jgi:replicative DNA helicase
VNETPATKPALKLAQPYPLASLVGLLADDAERRRAALLAGRQTGPITNLPRLDKILGGRMETGLHILHGGPGAGKSALALGVAAECGVPALFVSAELGAVEVLRRLIARTTGKYLGRLKSGELTADAVRELAERTASALPLFSIMDATVGSAPTEHIAAVLGSMREAPGADAAKGDGALVIVDSAHTWAARVWPDQEEYVRLGLALDELELLAKKLDIPVLLIAERNRASMKGGGQSASAGSRRFEYAGESVIELDSIEKETEDSDGWRTVKLTVSKNRHGGLGEVLLRWHGAMQKHTEKGDF